MDKTRLMIAHSSAQCRLYQTHKKDDESFSTKKFLREVRPFLLKTAITSHQKLSLALADGKKDFFEKRHIANLKYS